MGFKHVLSLLIGERMHLVLSEHLKLNDYQTDKILRDTSEENFDYIIEHILSDIASGTVKSSYINEVEARNALCILHGKTEGIDDTPEY